MYIRDSYSSILNEPILLSFITIKFYKPWVTECQDTYYFVSASTHQQATRILANNDYTYDNVGNRLSKTLSVQALNGDGSGQVQQSGPSQGFPVWTSQVTEHYTYDALNRLSGVNYGDGETQSYGFDPMGNRLVKMDATAGGTVTTNSAYDLANRLTSVNGASYVNDANGNTLSGGGRTMTWDSQNRMVSSAYSGNTLTFDYGSDGLRRSETLTSGGQSVTTYYVYDGQSLVMEETKNAQGVLTPSASYLNGPRGPEYKKDETTGLVKWYLYDGLGSVIGEVDPAGNVTYSAKYDVYGGVRATTGTATSAQGFVGGCGHLSEAATGLIYMRARYYDPSTGRFVSQDPKGNGTNWYIYCNGNPVNNIDKDGKAVLTLTDILNLFENISEDATNAELEQFASYLNELADYFLGQMINEAEDATEAAKIVATAKEDDDPEADAAAMITQVDEEQTIGSIETEDMLREVAALLTADEG